MNKKKYIRVAGIIIVVAGVVGVAFWLWKDGVLGRLFSSSATAQDGTPQSGGGAATGQKAATDAFPLRRGSRGANVRRLQELLNNAILMLSTIKPFRYMNRIMKSIAVDGVWGPATQAAVDWFYYGKKNKITQEEFNQMNVLYNKPVIKVDYE